MEAKAPKMAAKVTQSATNEDTGVHRGATGGPPLGHRGPPGGTGGPPGTHRGATGGENTQSEPVLLGYTAGLCV